MNNHVSRAAAERRRKPSLKELGDFTTTAHVIPISLLAIVIGVVSTFVAWMLLKLIGFFTNLAYFHRFDASFVSPAGNQLGVYAIAVPVVGSLIVGLMARYGSERIRGHGIPEAIESILMNGSRVHPRLALLKPASAAISIGTGGLFGAEGPIIMTGGAFGSMIGQFFHLTSVERRTLLVAGACAGMSATFAAPLSSVLIGVELLLFEWKPRSAIPVALASATACVARRYILGLGPLFPVPSHPAFIGLPGLGGCIISGLAAGALSALLPFASMPPKIFFRSCRFTGCGGPPLAACSYDDLCWSRSGEVRDLDDFSRFRHLWRTGTVIDDGRCWAVSKASSYRTSVSDSGRLSAWARFLAARCVLPLLALSSPWS